MKGNKERYCFVVMFLCVSLVLTVAPRALFCQEEAENTERTVSDETTAGESSGEEKLVEADEPHQEITDLQQEPVLVKEEKAELPPEEPPVSEEVPHDKPLEITTNALARGLANLGSGAFEIPITVANTSGRYGILKGITLGTWEGIERGAERMFSGGWDIFTCLFNLVCPEQAILSDSYDLPSYIFETEKDKERRVYND